MSKAQKLDTFYDGVSLFTDKLSFFPYTAARSIFFARRAGQNAQMFQEITSDDRSVEPATKLLVELDAAEYTNGMMLFLTPILLPLTIVSFALALAIQLASIVSQLIAYPAAWFWDGFFDPIQNYRPGR